MDPADRTLIEGEDDACGCLGLRQRRDLLWVLLESARPLALSSRHALHDGRSLLIGRGPERRFLRAPAAGAASELHLPDGFMSSRHARLHRQGQGWQLQDEGSTNGTRVNGERVASRRLVSGDLIEVGHTLLYFREGVDVESNEAEDIECGAAESETPTVLTLSPRLRRHLGELRAVVRSDVPVLIGGETGTGKEVLARQLAREAEGPDTFVGVNCAAIPDNLIESELFGSTKGSFSGATADRIGLIRSAHGGWLFLDEIGDLPLAAQAALLRVLQEREVRPVGASRAYPVHLRLISATHQDLEAMVQAGTFRGDLLARIAGYRIELPPLRDRVEDMGILIGTLLAAVEGERASQRTLAPEAVLALCRYRWRFNVRELRNCLATAGALAGPGPIRVEHLPEEVRAGVPNGGSEEGPAGPAMLTPEQEQHRSELVELLREHRGNVSALARATGKARSQYQRWFRRYGLDPERFRD